MSAGFDYDVFFSYRHRTLDSEITKRCFNKIESYKLPAALKKQGFEDVHRAFRDTEELAVSTILTDTIDKALHSTNCLIIVCSLDTPSSEWVDREVATFIKLGRADHIFPLLISGDPERSFPRSLKLVPDAMDRLMDIRVPGNDVKKMMAKAETELLRAVAGITGCDEDELFREHKFRRNSRIALRAAAAAGAFLAVAGVSLGLMNRANEYRDTARVREEASMQMLQDLTYSLPDKLTNVPGAYTRIAELLRKNTEDINEIVRLSTDKESAEFEAAANYEKLATAAGRLGEYEDAISSENRAIEVFDRLAAAGYARGTEALASAYANRGAIYKVMGDYAGSSADFNRAIGLYETGGAGGAVTLATLYYNAGSNAAEAGSNQEAEEMFSRSLGALAGAEKSAETLSTGAQIEYNRGLLFYRTGRYAEAETALTNACSQYEELIALSDSRLNRSGYVKSASLLATCCTDRGAFDRAGEVYASAIEYGEAYFEGSDNVEDIRMLAGLYNNYGLCRNVCGDYAGADGLYGKASELFGVIRTKTGTPADAATYATTVLNTGENAFKAGKYDRSRAMFEKGLEEYASVCETLGTYDVAQYFAWLSYYQLIHERDYGAALNSAMIAYENQADNVLVNLNLAYACLYSGDYEDADWLFSVIAGLGSGQAETIRLDLEAQQRAGMQCSHVGYVLEQLSVWSA